MLFHFITAHISLATQLPSVNRMFFSHCCIWDQRGRLGLCLQPGQTLNEFMFHYLKYTICSRGEQTHLQKAGRAWLNGWFPARLKGRIYQVWGNIDVGFDLLYNRYCSRKVDNGAGCRQFAGLVIILIGFIISSHILNTDTKWQCWMFITRVQNSKPQHGPMQQKSLCTMLQIVYSCNNTQKAQKTQAIEETSP